MRGTRKGEDVHEREQRKGKRHVLYISRVSGTESFLESCIISDTNVPKLHM